MNVNIDIILNFANLIKAAQEKRDENRRKFLDKKSQEKIKKKAELKITEKREQDQQQRGVSEQYTIYNKGKSAKSKDEEPSVSPSKTKTIPFFYVREYYKPPFELTRVEVRSGDGKETAYSEDFADFSGYDYGNGFADDLKGFGSYYSPSGRVLYIRRELTYTYDNSSYYSYYDKAAYPLGDGNALFVFRRVSMGEKYFSKEVSKYDHGICLYTFDIVFGYCQSHSIYTGFDYTIEQELYPVVEEYAAFIVGQSTAKRIDLPSAFLTQFKTLLQTYDPVSDVSYAWPTYEGSYCIDYPDQPGTAPLTRRENNNEYASSPHTSYGIANIYWGLCTPLTWFHLNEKETRKISEYPTFHDEVLELVTDGESLASVLKNNYIVFDLKSDGSGNVYKWISKYLPRSGNLDGYGDYYKQRNYGYPNKTDAGWSKIPSFKVLRDDLYSTYGQSSLTPGSEPGTYFTEIPQKWIIYDWDNPDFCRKQAAKYGLAPE